MSALSYTDDGLKPLAMTWDLLDLDPLAGNFQLNFTDPLGISQNDMPDVLLVLVNFNSFKSVKEQKMPKNTLQRIFIPPQLPSNETVVSAAADSFSSATTVTFAASFLINLILSQALS